VKVHPNTGGGEAMVSTETVTSGGARVAPGHGAKKDRVSRSRRSRTFRFRRLAGGTGGYLLLGGYSVISLFPLLWMVNTSLKTPAGVFADPPQWVPSPFSTMSYSLLDTTIPIADYFVNSVVMTVLVVAGQLLLGVPAAYAFARVQFRGRRTLFLMLMSGLMVPPIVVMIPLFIALKNIGWIDSLQGLVVPQLFAFGTPILVVFFLRQYFVTLPPELEEAAAIDGAGQVRTLLTVILPNSWPALATGGAMSLVAAWNNFLWPLLVTNDLNGYTLTVGVGSLVGQFREANWGVIMAASAFILIPIVGFFIATHKAFMASLSTTGLK
jgi:multiple sugar transport system permease protein